MEVWNTMHLSCLLAWLRTNSACLVIFITYLIDNGWLYDIVASQQIMLIYLHHTHVLISFLFTPQNGGGREGKKVADPWELRMGQSAARKSRRQFVFGHRRPRAFQCQIVGVVGMWKKKREANRWSLPPRPGCQTAGSRAPTTPPPPLAWLLIPESWVSDSSCQTQPVERAASSAGPNVLTVTFLFRFENINLNSREFRRRYNFPIAFRFAARHRFSFRMEFYREDLGVKKKKMDMTKTILQGKLYSRVLK